MRTRARLTPDAAMRVAARPDRDEMATSVQEPGPAPSPRSRGLPPAPIRPALILGLQRTVGNQAVQRWLAADVQRRPAGAGWAVVRAKSTDEGDERLKSIEEGDERQKTALPSSPLAGRELARCGPGCGCAHCATAGDEERAGARVARAPDVALAVEQVPAGAQSVDDGRAADAATDLRAKASTSVKSGAAPSTALGAGDYGLTMEERVDVTIGATLDKATNTWSPKVKSLAGHYSQQVRLLPGQSEITGPGGNTTKANHCDQAANLDSLGNTVGNKWYMLSAVRAHENVHATRFGPGLKAAVTAIVTPIEAVTIPNTPKMKAAQAIVKLKANATFKAEVANAKNLWMAEDNTRLAHDHDPGGPTDTAEHTIVDPMLKSICKHAKKKKWPACASCP